MYRDRVSDTDGFVDALMASPLGVALLGFLEAGGRHDRLWTSRSTTTATVAAAVDAVSEMSFGQFVDAAVYTSVIESGPWIGDAALSVANGYRNAQARAPIAEAIHERFGEVLHVPLDPGAQQWWTDDQSCREPVTRRFVDYEDVYGSGQFTWAGLWSVTDPPEEAHDQLVDAWEYEVGPVSRCWLPVRPEAKIFEIHRPEDWARLVSEHPREGPTHSDWELPGLNQHHSDIAALEAVPGQSGVRTSVRRNLAPDWRSIASQYDGVHLSWAGFITSEGYISDLPGGDVTMLRYWFSERTLWLADVFGEPDHAPPFALGDSWDQRPTVPALEQDLRSNALRVMLGRWTCSNRHRGCDSPDREDFSRLRQARKGYPERGYPRTTTREE